MPPGHLPWQGTSDAQRGPLLGEAGTAMFTNGILCRLSYGKCLQLVLCPEEEKIGSHPAGIQMLALGQGGCDLRWGMQVLVLRDVEPGWVQGPVLALLSWCRCALCSMSTAFSAVAQLLGATVELSPGTPAKRPWVSWGLGQQHLALSGPGRGPQDIPSHPSWPADVYTRPCTHLCLLTRTHELPGKCLTPASAHRLELRFGPRDRALSLTPHGELAEGPLGSERTVFTRGDVAALPVGGPRPPGAQVLRHSLAGVGVHTLHTPGLEAIVAAGGCAQGPQADPPVYAAGL